MHMCTMHTEICAKGGSDDNVNVCWLKDGSQLIPVGRVGSTAADKYSREAEVQQGRKRESYYKNKVLMSKWKQNSCTFSSKFGHIHTVRNMKSIYVERRT